MFQHHPELVETGELEIVQRAALHAAVQAGQGAAEALGSNVVDVRPIVAAYLAEMQRSWHPGPIVISEGDHIVIGVGEMFVKVGVEREPFNDLRVTLDDGDEVHYPTRHAPDET